MGNVIAIIGTLAIIAGVISVIAVKKGWLSDRDNDGIADVIEDKVDDVVDAVEDKVDNVKEAVKKLPVKVRIIDGVSFNPSEISSEDTIGYKNITEGINEVFPGALIAPSITLAGTDSRHYTSLCKDNYRFIPISITGEDTNRIHGVNERISETNYLKMIKFYKYNMELLWKV